MTVLFKDKVFLKNLYVLALPIILNELLNSSINIMDTFMIGQLGPESVSAVSLGNQLFFIFTLCNFGVCSGASVFMGQYWGARDVKGVKKVLGIALMLSISIALLFFIAAYFVPSIVMNIYSNDPNVVEIGTQYLKVVGFSYFLTSITTTFNTALKAIGKAQFPMITTFIALATNVCLNYVFIFLLQLGAAGAAYGTLCARTLETIVVLAIVFGKKLPIAGKFRDYIGVNKDFILMYAKISLPVFLNESMWGLGTTIYNIAYKYSGTVAQASVQVASVVQNLFVVAGMGIGAASGILISNALGARDVKRAEDYADRCMIVSILLSVIMGVILAINTGWIVNLFNIGADGRANSAKMLYVVSIGLTLKTINYTGIVGILRNGGDTLFCFILDAVSVWFIGIPMAFLGSYFLHLPIYVTFTLVYIEEFVKLFFSLYRVKVKKKWIKTVI